MLNKKNYINLLIIFLFSFCSLANVLYFISLAASPLIRDDGWFFLDSFYRPIVERGLQLSDFFVKRSISDHAQPLNKLLSLINYNYFSLDYRFESIIGFLSIVLILGILIYFSYKERLINSKFKNLYGIIAAILILCSLNSTNIYTWPLVTFGFLYIAIYTLIFYFIYNILIREKVLKSAFTIIPLFILIGDTSSILAILAAIVAILISKIEGHKSFLNLRKLGIAFLLIIFGFSYYYIINKGIASNLREGHIANLFDLSYLYKIPKIIFTSSLIHQEHLSASIFSKIIEYVSCTLVGLGLINYTFKLIHTKKTTLIGFVILALFIQTIASILGIIVGRVPEFGLDYLYQPRYILVYQMIPFLLILDLSLDYQNYNWNQGLYRIFLKLIFIFILFLQIFFSYSAYKSVEWISRYYVNEAKLIGLYFNHLNEEKLPCTYASNSLCLLSIEKRIALLNLMNDKKLNILNETFQWKYRLFPFDEKAGNIKLDKDESNANSALPNLPITIKLLDKKYPEYVSISGLGGPEEWGRWSESKEVVLKFNSELPKSIKISGIAMAFGSNKNKPIKVLFGNKIQQIRLPGNDFQKFDISFNSPSGSREIVFIIPDPVRASNLDLREIGVAFKSIQISN